LVGAVFLFSFRIYTVSSPSLGAAPSSGSPGMSSSPNRKSFLIFLLLLSPKTFRERLIKLALNIKKASQACQVLQAKIKVLENLK
jgi:hypothetical protein